MIAKKMFKHGDTSCETRSMLQDMQANQQTQVLKKVSVLNKELHDWEASFFLVKIISVRQQKRIKILMYLLLKLLDGPERVVNC